MRISVLQDRLKNALSIASRFVPSRRVYPILGNVLIKTDDSSVYLIATDFEKSVRVKMNATVDTEGEYTVPASTLSEFVATLPNGSIVVLNLEDDKLHVVMNKIKGKVAGIDADQYPVIDFSFNPETDQSFSIKTDELKDLLNSVLYAAAKEDNRPILMGVLVSFDSANSILKMISSDGYRLAQTQATHSSHRDIKVTIPAKFLAEVYKSLGGDDEVQMVVKGNSVGFYIGDVVFQSLVIDGKFPDVSTLIPNKCDYKISVNRDEMVSALKRASIFAPEDSDMVCLDISGESLRITSAALSGDSDNEVQITTNNLDHLQISFKAKYLIEALSVLDDEVFMETRSGTSPLKIYSDTEASSVHVIMPISKR